MKFYSATLLSSVVVLAVFRIGLVQAVDEFEKINKIRLESSSISPDLRSQLSQLSPLESFKTQCNTNTEMLNNVNYVKGALMMTFLSYTGNMVKVKSPPGSPTNSPPSPSSPKENSDKDAEALKLFTNGTLALCDNIKNDKTTCSQQVRNSIPLLAEVGQLYLKIEGEAGRKVLKEHCGTVPNRG